PVPTNAPSSTPGPDGNLWFTGLGDLIGRITTSGVVTGQFTVPTAGGTPLSIFTGPDNLLYFTEFNGNKIGRISPTSGVITEFPIPTPNSGPAFIVTGPDNKLWFTQPTANLIGQFDTTRTLTATGVTFTDTQNVALTATVATFTDTDGVQPPSDYTATINWGDGTPTTLGVITGAAGNYTVTGTHTYAIAGSIPVTIHIVDTADGDTADANSTANVAAVIPVNNLTAVPVRRFEGQTLTGDVATFTAPPPRAPASNFHPTT